MTEIINGIKAYYPKSRGEWRKWLEKNHAKAKAVWLIMYNKGSQKKTITQDEAVKEALCFGWIDSKAIKRDAESRYQYMAIRKPGSNWSRVNRGRVSELTKQGLMTPAGQVLVDLAKKTGRWTALEESQSSVLPKDLEAAFAKNKKAKQHFDTFPPSSKRIILEWILNAKRPETREKRIKETVALAAKNIRANHYQQ
jgi:uncharacterized protein YdeI (YjbR/CyaY-like superfamily)